MAQLPAGVTAALGDGGGGRALRLPPSPPPPPQGGWIRRQHAADSHRQYSACGCRPALNLSATQPRSCRIGGVLLTVRDQHCCIFFGGESLPDNSRCCHVIWWRLWRWWDYRLRWQYQALPRLIGRSCEMRRLSRLTGMRAATSLQIYATAALIDCRWDCTCHVGKCSAEERMTGSIQNQSSDVKVGSNQVCHVPGKSRLVGWYEPDPAKAKVPRETRHKLALPTAHCVRRIAPAPRLRAQGAAQK